VVQLARAHGLSAYDASYLQIALALRVPLATLDTRLGKVADKLGIRAVADAAASPAERGGPARPGTAA